jgi:hypothetical protein
MGVLAVSYGVPNKNGIRASSSIVSDKNRHFVIGLLARMVTFLKKPSKLLHLQVRAPEIFKVNKNISYHTGKTLRLHKVKLFP